MLDNHAPFKRIISDEATAIDRQWLRMMNDVFSKISHETLVTAGYTPIEATRILGVVALKKRLCDDIREAA